MHFHRDTFKTVSLESDCSRDEVVSQYPPIFCTTYSKMSIGNLKGIDYKSISLLTLVIQNSMLVLILQYSKSLPGPNFLPATAVMMAEILKLVICLSIHMYNQKERSLEILFVEVFGANSDWKAMTVPAGLYFLQNNLQFIAVILLDGPTFQVTCQLKIITTALFSVSMLGRKLELTKWFSLLLLASGIAIVQVSKAGTTAKEQSSGDEILGFSAVIVASILSGLAGVWFEKVLKGSQTSIFIRNIQLSLFSAIPALTVISM